ncbi:ABC transporter substrate-binding protein [Sediminibacillus albus]|uniref:Iron complex transport system substrate-binding protein n=1 Tax=Sediminibacillus albus TaxID=407036 RepID=A0A1G9ALH8_9BACI|nr:ABC transporter substrate-binding protein [Sediminibacillus albus]SDK27674.1 iron complex transport system substrate-binding protein [Sediminibacillus albus]
MKTSLIYSLLSLLIAIALVGCGGNGEDSAENGNTSEEKGEETTDTRTAAHDAGETEVPVNPEKVVTSYYVGHLLSLDEKPIGAIPTELDNPFIQDQVSDIEDIGNPVSVEKVIELDPDLIIAADQESYEQLQKVAPTVLIEYGKHHVKEEMEMLGGILGKEQEAEDWIAQFEEKGEKAKEKLEGVIGEDETVSIVEIWANHIYVYGNKWGRGGYNLYNVLDLNPPEMVQEELIDDQPYLEISLESLPDVAGDHIFLSVYGDDGGDKRAEEIKNSNVWQSLDAVKNDQVYEINLDEFFYFDPIALEEQLEIQLDLMLNSRK